MNETPENIIDGIQSSSSENEEIIDDVKNDTSRIVNQDALEVLEKNEEGSIPSNYEVIEELFTKDPNEAFKLVLEEFNKLNIRLDYDGNKLIFKKNFFKKLYDGEVFWGGLAKKFYEDFIINKSVKQSENKHIDDLLDLTSKFLNGLNEENFMLFCVLLSEIGYYPPVVVYEKSLVDR